MKPSGQLHFLTTCPRGKAPGNLKLEPERGAWNTVTEKKTFPD